MEKIVNICIWPVVTLVIIFVLHKPLGQFLILLGEGLKTLLTNIGHFSFSKTKDSTNLALDTNLKTYSTQIPSKQIQDTPRKEKFEKLEMLLKKEEFVQVGEICKKWRKEDPENIGHYLFQGRAYLEQGKFEMAEKEFSKSFGLENKDPQSYYYLAKIPFAKENYSKAKNLLEKARELDGKEPRVNLALAFVAYCYEKNIDKSLTFAQVAHDSYKERENLLPLSKSLDFDIHQCLEYYLADRGRQEDFERAFDVDSYLEQVADKYFDKDWVSKRQRGFALDTRGYLRYKAIKENYDKNKNKIFIKTSIDFFTKALELIPSDQDIVLHLIEAIKISNIMK